MQHTEDQGAVFGTWNEPTARLMYHDIMPLALCGVDTSGRVADYGGANGLLREWIPQAVTVDYDETKNPDIVADIAEHVGEYDLVVMRYVLHYMPDVGVRTLFRHLASFHTGRILVIQFCNDDLASKYLNSIGETKWFRRAEDTFRLVNEFWRVVEHKVVDYRVDAEFYRQRLGHPDPSGHRETILILELEPKL